MPSTHRKTPASTRIRFYRAIEALTDRREVEDVCLRKRARDTSPLYAEADTIHHNMAMMLVVVHLVGIHLSAYLDLTTMVLTPSSAAFAIDIMLLLLLVSLVAFSQIVLLYRFPLSVGRYRYRYRYALVRGDRR